MPLRQSMGEPVVFTRSVQVHDPITGPVEVVEGEEIEFRLRLNRTGRGRAESDDLRLEVEASY